jgi:hypothetical protein
MLPLLLLACATPKAPAAGDLGGAEDSAALEESATADPFASPPVDDGGLTNVADNAMDLVEGGGLVGACEDYAAKPDDNALKLRCGKWMFFYEDFGTAGVPTALVDMLLTSFSDEVGPAFSAYGLIADPTSAKGYPLGLVEGDHGVAFTCASCHMGALPDGRLAVGAANLRFAYGPLNLAFAVFPLAALSAVTGAEIHPDAQAAIQPLLDHLAADVGLQLTFLGALMGLLSEEIPAFSVDNQGHYAAWPAGTMDFLIEPLPIDDEAHTVSKISALWGIPTEAEVEAAGMTHAMLGWTGNTTSLRHFVGLFDALGGGDGANWAAADLEPLAAYVESLQAPTAPAVDAPTVERGADLFVEAGCIACHQGPRGSGLKLYSYEEIGTDDALAAWFDADMDGEPCCGVDMSEDPVTHALKSPRLVGLWAMDRFLHNGSVTSLDALLCVEGPRVPIDTPALTNGGHTYGCDTLSAEEKSDLIAYLLSH